MSEWVYVFLNFVPKSFNRIRQRRFIDRRLVAHYAGFVTYIFKLLILYSLYRLTLNFYSGLRDIYATHRWVLNGRTGGDD